MSISPSLASVSSPMGDGQVDRQTIRCLLCARPLPCGRAHSSRIAWPPVRCQSVRRVTLRSCRPVSTHPPRNAPSPPVRRFRPSHHPPLLPPGVNSPVAQRFAPAGAALPPAAQPSILAGAALPPAAQRFVPAGAALPPRRATFHSCRCGAPVRRATLRPCRRGASARGATLRLCRRGAPARRRRRDGPPWGCRPGEQPARRRATEGSRPDGAVSGEMRKRR